MLRVKLVKDYTFANILFVSRQGDILLEENELQFILATAIKTIHGEITNCIDILSFQPLDKHSYSAIVRFKTVHYQRVVTSLLLFGRWKEVDCRIEIKKISQSPCLLSI